MVGDGVNDVPALKEARLAIAQGSGTQMAKSVADLVLVRGDFAAVPGMVAEGRQILRNLQRVAKLYVSKSAFAAFLILTRRHDGDGLPAAAAPLQPRREPHDRHPVLPARARAELRAVGHRGTSCGGCRASRCRPARPPGSASCRATSSR